MKYFANIKTLEELKKEYKKLALENHPDRGGDVEVMKAINAEYDIMFNKVKDIHVNAKGETYTKENTEAPSEFKDIIDKLIRMEGLEIEIIGCFIWLSGNTRAHKDNIKALGFKWHSTKKMWYKAPEDYRKRSKKKYSIEEIRDMYGTSGTFTGKGALQLQGA
ncbi:MAG: molecular chaperone DnaJ [Firmicutes bacterium]|nr:molecular chaperone DnaJ [Bacillota bacterium]